MTVFFRLEPFDVLARGRRVRALVEQRVMTVRTTSWRKGGVLRALAVGTFLVAALLVGAAAEAQSLRGSGASLNRQVEQADLHDFSYLENANRVQRFVDAGLLVPLYETRDYWLKGVSFPVARPAVKLFIDRLANQYRAACGERLVVTSLTRPLANQPRNASQRSVHPTGMAMDLRRPYPGPCRDWLEDTLLYCYHVAGVVGVMMTYVMGVSDASVLRRAADLGIAFQLTNIARDVMDDASAGRCYLPQELLRNNGVPPEQIANPEYRASVVKVAKELLRVADRYYASAAEGVRALPLRAAWAICTARGVYRDIGEIVLAQGESAWQRRAVVSKSRKMFWVFAGGMRAIASVGLRRFQQAAPRATDLWMKPGIN